MDNSLLLGIGRVFVPIPRQIWQRDVARSARQFENALQELSEAHLRVRNFVVRELPRYGRPLSPELIANRLDLPVDQVQAILDELERKKVFLFRDEQGAVIWAYPVTAVSTPHRVTLSTGEQFFAA